RPGRCRHRHQSCGEIPRPADPQRPPQCGRRRREMTTTLLAISAAYVLLSVLLLWAGIASPLRWWIKAGAIVVTSVFFVEAFFASKSLLGWPSVGRLPGKFQLLWTRVVE